jgi:hypothetical protein
MRKESQYSPVSHFDTLSEVDLFTLSKIAAAAKKNADKSNTSSKSLRLNKILGSKPIPNAGNTLRPEIRNTVSTALKAYKNHKLKPLPGHGGYQGKTYGATFRGTF